MGNVFALKPQSKKKEASLPTRHPACKPGRKREAWALSGMPLFLKRSASSSPGSGAFQNQTKPLIGQTRDVYEQEADRVADTVINMPGCDAWTETDVFSPFRRNGEIYTSSQIVQRKDLASTANQPSALGRAIDQNIRANQEKGQPLPAAIRESLENKFGNDFSEVRIHTDAKANKLAHSLGANAFATGRDIYFNKDRYSPNSSEGNRLLAHELTHVVQQGGETSGHVQFNLMQSLPTALGAFEIDMATRTTPMVGMEGHIRFLPDPSGPYSARIGLIQTANVTDVGGSTTTPGSPLDWRNDGAGAEAGRMDLMTTGTLSAPEGWFVDALTAAHARGSSIEPYYLEHAGHAVGHNEYGWLRSPTDVKNASIYDYPSTPHPDIDFDFETVAKAADTQVVYGALDWGFNIRSGVVQNEYVDVFDIESPAFNEALERYRGYYTHEPIIIYFDTDKDRPLTGEEAKFTGVLDYLDRYPDVQIDIAGYADERGSPSHNADLSLRRALNVQSLLISLGVDASRIDVPIGMGETRQFSPGGGRNAGSWRANRRVVVSFRRTQSTPIVMP